MMTEKLQKELNVQINAEMWSSNLYLSMAFYLKNKGLDGCANWLMKQSQEELNHAYEIADYLNKRGEKAEVGMVDVVPTGWGDVAEVFKNVYDHECHVSKLIDELVDVASAEKDKATQDFLWGFVREQVEEEATARDLAEKFAKAGEAGILFLDSQLAQRKQTHEKIEA